MLTRRKIKVLLADDSSVARMLLLHLLKAEPDIEVVGAVADGAQALEFVQTTRPDVILMDVHMPGMDGLQATRGIMETSPVPIVVCSAASNVQDTALMFRALQAGAVACIEKPLSRADAAFDAKARHLLQTVKLMSEVKVVRRRGRPSAHAAGAARPAGAAPRASARLVGIGASTGGPPVLQSILAGLPCDFPLPLLVVQHIAPGFLAGMLAWLADTSSLKIRIAAYGTIPLPGHVYLAPDDFHMGVNTSGRIVLSRQAPENHMRPAVSFLFRSLAENCGAAAIGVLLTGMGRDGAAELKQMRDCGAVTIAQDQASSVVHGMPGSAIALQGAAHVLPADDIAQALVDFAPPTGS